MSEEEKKDEPKFTHIGGEKVELLKEHKPRVAESKQMESAYEKLQDRRAGVESDDPDYYTSEQEERTVYKNTEAALEHDREQNRVNQEARQELEEMKAEEKGRQTEQWIKSASTWAEPDRETLNRLGSEAQQFEEQKQAFLNVYQRAQQDPGKLTDRDIHQIQQTARQLQAREQQLMQAGQKVHQAARVMDAERERRALYRDIPELKDPKNREKLIAWAKEKGIPDDVARGETDRTTVARVWKEYEKEQKESREKHLNRPRKPLYSPPGMYGENMTVEQAEKRLKETGSETDAFNLMTLRKQRAREAQNG